MHVNCYYLISFYVYIFQAISKLNMDNNYSAILQERRNILHLNNLYVLRRCMQVAILFKILTCQPTWYIREVYSGLPERPEIVRLKNYPYTIFDLLEQLWLAKQSLRTTCLHTLLKIHISRKWLEACTSLKLHTCTRVYHEWTYKQLKCIVELALWLLQVIADDVHMS